MINNKEIIPFHIGIILDGNGRWAKKRNLPRSYGHKKGMDTVIKIVREASNKGIKILSLYCFSTENWKRPNLEVEALMNLLVVYIENELNKLNEENVKIMVSGDISKLPKKSLDAVEKSILTTKNNTGMILNLLINYGGRDEILRAFKTLYTDIVDGNLSINDISTNTISKYLYTSNLKDPDLIIRTGGELRLSNFLTYQSSYSELYFTDKYWPDFNEYDLDLAISEFNNRNRRYGNI